MTDIPEDVKALAEKIAHEHFYNWRALADAIAEAVDEAVTAERERCAKIAEVSGDWRGPKEIAAAIRRWKA